jgi:hypothetical protein
VTIQRWGHDPIIIERGYDADLIMRPDGDYVLYSDHIAAVAEARAEPVLMVDEGPVLDAYHRGQRDALAGVAGDLPKAFQAISNGSYQRGLNDAVAAVEALKVLHYEKGQTLTAEGWRGVWTDVVPLAEVINAIKGVNHE